MLRIGESLRVASTKRKWPSPTVSSWIGWFCAIRRTIGVLPHMPKSRLPETNASTIGSADG